MILNYFGIFVIYSFLYEISKDDTIYSVHPYIIII